MRVGWFFLAAALPCAAAGQGVGHDLENAWKDFLHVWAAPGRLDSDDLPVLGVLLRARRFSSDSTSPSMTGSTTIRVRLL
jgi:hypothetical protein